MLKDIKSSYFNCILFSYIQEGQKLKLIKYNKSLQKNMNISIINYKYFIGTYIIYESNGIGKEYDGLTDTLMFEGKFKNGERNGKGKEYNFWHYNVIDFEGEYFYGKRWNGKGYDNNNKVVYELINGKGYAKEYYDVGKIEFEGEYLNGKRNGKGKEYDFDGNLRFEGEYLN